MYFKKTASLAVAAALCFFTSRYPTAITMRFSTPNEPILLATPTTSITATPTTFAIANPTPSGPIRFNQAILLVQTTTGDIALPNSIKTITTALYVLHTRLTSHQTTTTTIISIPIDASLTTYELLAYNLQHLSPRAQDGCFHFALGLTSEFYRYQKSGPSTSKLTIVVLWLVWVWMMGYLYFMDGAEAVLAQLLTHALKAFVLRVVPQKKVGGVMEESGEIVSIESTPVSSDLPHKTGEISLDTTDTDTCNDITPQDQQPALTATEESNLETNGVSC